ncbi:unnamed protein product [Jaminaea pallidilutea]
MVCAKCEKKLSSSAAPDPYRNRDAQGFVKGAGSSNASRGGAIAAKPGASSSGAGPIRNTNKLFSSKAAGSNRFHPLSSSSSSSGSSLVGGGGEGGKCKICKTPTTSMGKGVMASYCSACAYKRGVCQVCGKMVLDAKTKSGMKMSS